MRNAELGNLTATPEEIFSLASHLGVEVVFIDGAYLLMNTAGMTMHRSRHERIGDKLRYIKRAAASLGIPAVLSWQFNREAEKEMDKGKDPGLDTIGGSDEIGQISSIVLGLFERENAGTLYRRRISVLKGREGATGEFYMHWDFETMDFSQMDGSHGTGMAEKEGQTVFQKSYF